MTAPFQPADGNEARWKKVYQRIKGMPVDSVLTYTELGEMFPGLDRGSLQTVIRRAQKEFLEKDRRTLRNVRGEGYRAAAPDEHVQIARWHQERSVKSLRRGHDAVTHVDYNEMSPEVRALTEATGRALANQLDYIRRMDIRQKRLEEVLTETVDRTDAHEDQLKSLQERLARLENNT